MGKMKQLDMAKQELEAMSEPQEREQVINRDGKETKFFLSDLSNNAQRSYVRANQLAQEMVQLEMNLEEKRLLANTYINTVLQELEENKYVTLIASSKETKYQIFRYKNNLNFKFISIIFRIV